MNNRPILLYFGDVFAIFLFVALSRGTHPLAPGANALLENLNTALPFIMGWLLVAPWFGAFQPKAWASIRSTLITLVIAFVPAFVAGGLLRWLMIGRLSPAIFYAVTAAVILTLLAIWRLFYTLVLAPRLHR